jgi:hypothetical protein
LKGVSIHDHAGGNTGDSGVKTDIF